MYMYVNAFAKHGIQEINIYVQHYYTKVSITAGSTAGVILAVLLLSSSVLVTTTIGMALLSTLGGSLSGE